MKFKHISILALAAFLSSNVAFGQQQPTLNLKKGAKYQVENKVKTATVLQVQGQTMEVNVDGNTTYEIEVKDNKNNNYQLSNKISGLTMNMSQMGQEISFDSKKEEDMNGPIGTALKDYINVAQEVEIGKNGKVVPGEKKESDNAIAQQFGDFENSGFGATLVFLALPKDLSVGKTWTDRTEQNGTITNTTYKVKSISGNDVTLTTTGDMIIDTKMENMGMEVSNKSKGSFSGETVVDKTTNAVKSQTMEIKTDGTTQVMGQEMPTTTNIKSTTTVKVM